MWGEVDCPSCKGTGFEPGADGYWLDGIYYSGRFPCGDCNGSGKQPYEFDQCKKCGGGGKSPDGSNCPRCKGLGFHEPEPSRRTSWYEIIEG